MDDTTGIFNDFEKDLQPPTEVPTKLEVLPDGREVLVIGEPERLKEFNHQQGDNSFGFLGTCGLVSCEDILRQFGLNVTENDVVRYAIENGRCYTEGEPAQNGGTTPIDQAAILTDHGVPAHVEVNSSVEQLADYVEQGRGIIIEVNAGVLWNDPNYYGNGEMNHAIVVTGVDRDPSTGAVLGVYINDSGNGNSGQRIEVDQLRQMWIDPGGILVVTDTARPNV
jgi:hypothetical protein